jgi:hypothetical protein
VDNPAYRGTTDASTGPTGELSLGAVTRTVLRLRNNGCATEEAWLSLWDDPSMASGISDSNRQRVQLQRLLEIAHPRSKTLHDAHFDADLMSEESWFRGRRLLVAARRRRPSA